jgi:CDP-diacylglycerol---glycerol-3-phosphate 3-phosphatidyltransferase
MANAITVIRLLLVLPFAVLMAAPDAHHVAWAGLILTTAIATDVLDGVIARRRGTASAAGQLFDHATDVLFVTSGLAAGALRGAVPWILPTLVAAAFAQYVLDSYCLGRGQQLRASRLGRYNGILYFAPLGGDILVRLGWSSLQPLLTAVVWLLVMSTVFSMGERLIVALRARARGAGASPGAERGDRPRRS